MDILLSEGEHDAVFVNGETPVTASIDDGLKQRLKIKLLTFRGEWFLNTRYGTPYYQQIFGKGRSKAVVDSVFRDLIREDQDVVRITRFESTLSTGRDYSLSFSVISRTGNTVEIEELQIGI